MTPRGWNTVDGVAYPPEPWFLGGALSGSVFRVPQRALPTELRACIPPDHRLVTLGGQLPVAVSFVHYTAGGVLAYEELLVAVPVRRGLRVRCSVLQIWVDSPSSLAGGRALWNIPKQLASFEYARGERTVRTAMRDAQGELAVMDAALRARLPGRWQLPLTTAQRLQGRDVIATNSIIGRVRRSRARWQFAAGGPLAWLQRATPWLDLMIDDAIIAFGERVAR